MGLMRVGGYFRRRFLILPTLLALFLFFNITQNQFHSYGNLLLLGYLVEDCKGTRKNRLPTHLNIAERAIELLESDPNSDLHTEIFKSHLTDNDHGSSLSKSFSYTTLAENAKQCAGCAIVKGAKDEDDRVRAYNHFYSPSSNGGLPWHWYYGAPDWITHFCVTKPSTEVFSSALEWATSDPGTKIKDCHDKQESAHPMNWRGAIEAYGGGDKIAAYERLGHVIHLLGDMAQPDHAKLEPHPGSGCGGMAHVASSILSGISGAAEGALIGAAAGAAIGAGVGYAKGGTGGIKDGAITGAEYGALGGAVLGGAIGATRTATATSYEALVNDEWVAMDEGPPSVDVERHETLDDYFKTMASQSVSASEGFESPLGLENQLGVPLAPTIHSGDYKKYLDLAGKLIPHATGLCAGLLKLFHDIVRSPPYAKSVKITQESSGGTLEYSALVEDNLENDPETGRPTIKGRTLSSAIPETPYSTAQPITVQIEFGPEGTRIKESSLQVKIGDQSLTGEFSDGTHWEGKLEANQFRPESDQEEVALEIYAEDTLPHYQGVSGSQRAEPGNKLDTNPTTPAKPKSIAPFEWEDYESGSSEDWVDRNHKIKIAPGGQITAEVQSKM